MRLHRKLFFLLIVFLPTQLGFHFWPSWASILGRTIDYLSPTVYFTDILIFGLLILWFLETKLYKSFILHFVSSSRTSKGVLLLTSVFIFLNIYFAHNTNIALVAWIKTLECVLLGYYIYKQQIVLSDVIKPLAIGMVLISIIGLSQYVLQQSIGGLLWFLGERSFMLDTPAIARVTLCRLFSESCELRLRAYSTFSHPNVFGGYLAIILPLILLEVLRNTQTRVRRNIYGAVFVLGIIALISSFSRSAWVVAAMGVSSIFFLKQKIITWKVPIIIFICIMTLVGFFVAPIQDESVVVRQELNVASISIWQKSPIFGIGLNNFLFGLSPSLRSHQVYVLQPVHNIYLLALSQIGIAGLGLVLLYISLFISSVRGNLLKFSPVYVSLLSLLLLGIVDHYLFTLQQGQLLFILIVAMTAVVIKFPAKA